MLRSAEERRELEHCIDGYIDLAEAVIRQAAEDLADAYRRFERVKEATGYGGIGERIHAGKTITECEMFFRSPLFGILCASDIDGESVIESIRERAKEPARPDGRKHKAKAKVIIKG